MKSFKVSVVKMLSVMVAMLMLGTTSIFAQAVNVTFPTVSGTSGTTVTKAIVVNSNFTGQNVLSFGFKMSYDPNIVEVQSIDQNGTILSGKDILTSIDNTTGQLTVGWLSSNPLAGTGDFLNITFLFKNAGVSTLGLKPGTTFEINATSATVTPGSATTASKVVTVGSSSDKKVNDFIDIPITTTTALADGDNIVAFDFQATYDPTVLEYVGIVKTGSLSAGALEPTVNSLTPGALSVAVISATKITGTGDLIYVRMKALKKGASNFLVTAFKYNSGTPSVSVVNGTVSVANSDPVLTSPVSGDQHVAENSTITLTVSATDADGASDITYNTPTLPAGIPPAAWNAGTKTLTWTPGYDAYSATPYSVTFSVTDGSGVIKTSTVNIYVDNTNQLPSLTTTAATPYSVNEGSTVAFNLTAADADLAITSAYVESLSWNMSVTKDGSPYTFATSPMTGSGNTARAFSWTIPYDAVVAPATSGVYVFTFTVTDASGAVSTQSVTVNVANVNTAPSWSLTGAAEQPDRTAKEGIALTPFTYKAIDIDGDVLHYTLVGTPPTGSHIDELTGVFTYTPPLGSAGVHVVQAAASDQVNPAVVGKVTNITVLPNTAPTLTLSKTSPITVSEMNPVTFDLTAADVDLADGDEVTVVASGDLTANYVAATALTGTFTWTPPTGSAGTYNITFTATDLAGNHVAKTMQIVVENHAPVLALSNSNQIQYTVNESDPVTFNVSATDVDLLDVYSIAASGDLTSKYVATDTHSGTFTYNTTYGDAGTYNITFTVTDRAGLKDTKTVNIVVNKKKVAPVLALPVPALPTTVGAGTAVTGKFTATDTNPQDGATLAYSLTVSPAGATASIDAATGDLSFVASPTSDTKYTLTVTVTDQDGLTDSKSVDITVTQNQLPTVVVPASASTPVDEGSTISFQVTGTDPDAGETATLTFDYTPKIAGATFVNGLFTWTPGYDKAGTYPISFTATDVRGGVSVAVPVTITVNDVNRAPSLAAAGPFFVNGGSLLTFVLSGSDPDVDNTLTYTNGTLPEGATFNATTKTFSWTPAFHPVVNALVPYSVTVSFTVTDNHGASASQDVKITVVPVETAPSFAVTGAAQMNDVTIAEGETLTFTYKAIDAEGDAVTYKKLDPTPANAALDANTGVFSWKTNSGDAGTYTISIQASDGILSTASRNTKVTVTSSAKPVLTVSPAGPYSYPELTNISLALSATDDTRPTATFSYSATGLPTGAFLNTSTGAFAWTPAVGTANTYNIVFKVTDSFGFSATQNVELTITAAPKPTLSFSPAGPYTVAELSSLAIVVSGTDTNPGSTMTLSATGLPTGATFTAGTFSWTPASGQVGSYNVVFTVTDNYGLTASQTVAITVTSTNVAPTLTLNPVAPYSVNENELLTITLVGDDVNAGDVLTYSVTSPTTLPAGAKLTGNVFTWTPTYTQGTSIPYSFTFKVADQGGLSSSVTASITVVNVNRAPVFTASIPAGVIVPVHKAALPVYYNFQFAATDPDGQAVTFSLLGGAANMSLTTDGAFSWAPSLDQAGKSYTITVQATDGMASATSTVIITASATITSVEEYSSGVPTDYSLMQNYPNPFNPTTTIRFALPNESSVKLTVFNVLGQEVATLFEGTLAAGYHKIDFDASKLNSGMYIYRIEAGKFVSVKKMLLMK